MNFPDWRNIVTNIERRDPRERAVLLVLVISIVAYGWLVLVRDPLVQSRQQTAQQIAAVESQVQQQVDRHREIENSYREDPNAFARERLRELRQRIAAVDERLDELYGQLISPRQMAGVLTSILQRETGLQLVSLENLPSREMISTSAAAEGGDVQLYRHGIRLVLRGNYLETVRYLRSLESLDSSFFWDELTFELLDYPNGRIGLSIFTLSTQREWIGV